ncbi:hypothetical protein FIBSPDRAFT_1002322 [Athelia psychrophila]|uniref:Uncharacterized protein n=1 Tax=Athelia psychrophila TaxID=1759441 RepID=A0A166Q8X6_9AGAM|nr:hypothetical protein FIBSPDRAFT_1002322 [Fibularhizoctonia sp. CBS 109695]
MNRMAASSASQATTTSGASPGSRASSPTPSSSSDGCVINTVIGIVKQGTADVSRLTDNILLRRISPKPATKIPGSSIWATRREVTSAKKADAKPYTKAPEIQKFVTPIRLHHRRHLHSLRKRRIEHQKKQQTEYDVLIAKRDREKGQGRRGQCVAQAFAMIVSLNLMLFFHRMIHTNPCPAGDKFIPLRSDDTRNININWKMFQAWKGMWALVKNAQPPRVPQVGSDHRAGILPLGSINPPLLTDDAATAIAKRCGLQTSDVPLVICVSATYRPPDVFMELTLLVAVAQDVVALPKLVTPARIASNYLGTVAAVKRPTEENLQTLDGVAVGGKRERLTMSNCGFDFGLENWPWASSLNHKIEFPTPTGKRLKT